RNPAGDLGHRFVLRSSVGPTPRGSLTFLSARAMWPKTSANSPALKRKLLVSRAFLRGRSVPREESAELPGSRRALPPSRPSGPSEELPVNARWICLCLSLIAPALARPPAL